MLAALLASFSTIVRPMGILALAAIGLVLLFRKQFKTLAAASLIGVVIGGLYVVPLRLYKGSSFSNVQEYGQVDGNHGRPLTYPFVALLRGYTIGSVTSLDDARLGKSTALSLVNIALWIGIVLLGIVAMFLNPQFRDFARSHSVEVLFCALYVGLLFTYNSPWARAAFPRYAIPVIPFLILAFERWIPKDRRLLWAFGLASTVLSAFTTLCLANSVEMIRKVV